MHVSSSVSGPTPDARSGTRTHTHVHDAADDRLLAEAIVRQAAERSQTRPATSTRRLPRWITPALALLSQSLLIVAALNLLIGVASMVYPWLVGAFGASAMQPIWNAYSVICPQRPSHTWFIGDTPMAMEQRMVSMYVGFGVAGLLYCVRDRALMQRVGTHLPQWMRQPLPLALAVLGVAPALIDVAISTAGILPSTGFSRLWTGSLASLAIVAWGYPRYDEMLRITQRKVARVRQRERVLPGG